MTLEIVHKICKKWAKQIGPDDRDLELSCFVQVIVKVQCQQAKKSSYHHFWLGIRQDLDI